MLLQNMKESPASLRPYDNSCNALAAAINQKRLKCSPNSDLTGVLRYAMALIGLRAANMPTQPEFDFLKQFLLAHYANHTPAEIRLAFDLAVKGELELGSDGAKCFENFSCEYLGRIMTAYRVWAARTYKSLPETEQIPAPRQLSQVGARPKHWDWADIWTDILQAAKEDRLDKVIVLTAVYDWLESVGKINLTNEGKKYYTAQARSACINSLNNISDRRLTSAEKTELEWLRDGTWRQHEHLRVRVANKAKKHAVKDLALAIINNKNEDEHEA